MKIREKNREKKINEDELIMNLHFFTCFFFTKNPSRVKKRTNTMLLGQVQLKTTRWSPFKHLQKIKREAQKTQMTWQINGGILFTRYLITPKYNPHMKFIW